MNQEDLMEARRAAYRPQGQSFIRLTESNCVYDTDMHFLTNSDVSNMFWLNSSGEMKYKKFVPVLIGDVLHYIDVITGTVYDGLTGKSGSYTLFIDFDYVPVKRKRNGNKSHT